MNTQVKEWCAEQCRIQHATTPEDILGMETAWRFAEYMTHSPGQVVGIGMIRDLAYFVDPVANPGGRFRTGPAVFMSGGSAAPAQNVEGYLANLINALSDDFEAIGPEAFYRELMWIHPFKDGNGRVGALIYNILNGTINNPVNPPDYN